jgi:hypothetical protein
MKKFYVLLLLNAILFWGVEASVPSPFQSEKELSLRKYCRKKLEQLPTQGWSDEDEDPLWEKFYKEKRCPFEIFELPLLKMRFYGDFYKKNEEYILKMTSFTSLFLSSYQIKMGEGLSRLTNLKELTVSSLAEIPRSLFQLTSLENLQLASRRDRTEKEEKGFPSGILNLTRLTCLNVSRNNIGDVPTEITKLTLLISLDMSCNQISTFPEGFEMLDSLTYLNLLDNPIVERPKFITKLSKLDILHLPEGIKSSTLSQQGLYHSGNINVMSGPIYGSIASAPYQNLTPEGFEMFDSLTYLDLLDDPIVERREFITKLSKLDIPPLPEGIKISTSSQQGLWPSGNINVMSGSRYRSIASAPYQNLTPKTPKQ